MEHDTSVTRRTFLKTAAAAIGAPYVVTSAALGGAGVLPASERINVASIGVRGMGGGHLGGLLKRGDVQVVAICDVDAHVRRKRLDQAAGAYAERAKRGAFKGVAGVNDYRELMAREDVDAVVVATPDHNHAHISVAAIKAGMGVYVEKPMTLTIREGRAMAEAVQRYGGVLQCGSQKRSSKTIRRACELVRNKRIGELLRVEVGLGRRPGSPGLGGPEPVPEGFDYDLWLGPAPWAPYHPKRCHYNFRFIRDYSGGEMTNFGAHFLDVAQWGIGADDSGPVEIEGTGIRHKRGFYDVFFEFRIEYTYRSGVKLICTHKGHGARFIGTEGWITDGCRSEPKSIAKSQLRPDEVHLYGSGRGHMSDFLHCVRTRQAPAANVEIGHRSASVCHLGNIAMDLGRKLKWDPVKEEFPGDDEANRLTGRPPRSPWSL